MGNKFSKNISMLLNITRMSRFMQPSMNQQMLKLENFLSLTKIEIVFVKFKNLELIRKIDYWTKIIQNY